ncbi:unnamed protein product [Lathyrus sativus]|nr:unnamed protein product [Lathyrus sativus]
MDSAPLPSIDKLRDDFICTICLNIFFEPVTISCGHSFCKKCLVVAMDKYKKNCLVCRQWVNIRFMFIKF